MSDLDSFLHALTLPCGDCGYPNSIIMKRDAEFLMWNCVECGTAHGLSYGPKSFTKKGGTDE